MILVETPSNPLLRIVDIAAVSALARTHGVLLAVDNTFLSPILQQPIRLGADIVVHSTTKYLNGHSDVVGGAIIAATEELSDSLRWWANCLGPPERRLTNLRCAAYGPYMSGCVSRREAGRVTRFEQHPLVSRVYCGLIIPGIGSRGRNNPDSAEW
jgi:hypothetical protein